MSTEILCECPLYKKNIFSQVNYHLLVYAKKLVIFKTNFTQEKIKKVKSYNLQLMTTKIFWEISHEIYKGFQLCFLSQKSGHISIKTFRGDHKNLVELKKVLDGRAFYYTFSKQYELIESLPEFENRDSSQQQIQKCKNRQTGEVKVRKLLPLSKSLSLPNEVELSMKLKDYPHKYILSVDEIYLENDGIYLIMDYCEGGTIFKYFYKKKFQVPQQKIQQLMKRILKAVHHLHEIEIMHRDLKLDNLLLRYDNDLNSFKIMDLGLASYISEKSQLYCGTPGYIAPEILHGKRYNQLCDVYSLGCLFHTLLSGDRLFPQCDDMIEFNRMNNFRISKKINTLAKDLILRMLSSQSKRPSPLDCLSHPYFEKHSEIQGLLKKMDFPMMKNPFDRKPN